MESSLDLVSETDTNPTKRLLFITNIIFFLVLIYVNIIKKNLIVLRLADWLGFAMVIKDFNKLREEENTEMDLNEENKEKSQKSSLSI
jgi:hypothetical protein